MVSSGTGGDPRGDARFLMAPVPPGDLFPIGETARLAAVHRYHILDTPPDGTFDRFTALAARVLNVPIAVVSVVDRDRIWFKSRHGLDLAEVPRDAGLCASAILGDGLYVLPDATLDPVALTNPLVAGELGLRFYAAAPLRTSDGYNLGTLCVLDAQPRTLTASEMETLRDLADLVVRELEVRLEAREEAARQSKAQELVLVDKRHSEDILRALQVAVLPPCLPRIPGTELAVAYRPAEGSPVGGGFYDVFALPAGEWAISIGDVCGKDSRAAGVSAAARYSLRAAAVLHDTPAQMLDVLNATLLLEAPLEDARYCTAIAARLRPDGEAFRLTVASAGHPLPRILRADGSVEAVGGAGMLAGCFEGANFSERSVALAEGDAVVFFTDGLTEARCGNERLGDDAVSDLIRSCAGRSATDLAECLEEAAMAGGSLRDDVAILVLRINRRDEAAGRPDTVPEPGAS
jgi:sigma-B regulation protein RsbU (phosphoserine phosphatase)